MDLVNQGYYVKYQAHTKDKSLQIPQSRTSNQNY